MSISPQNTRMHAKLFSILKLPNRSPLGQYKLNRNLLSREKSQKFKNNFHIELVKLQPM